jgi:membrane-associated phospholipid phosphatase
VNPTWRADDARINEYRKVRIAATEEASSVDTRWYLDINRFARDTSWAHGFMAAYALWAGVTVLGLLLVAGWWRARPEGPRAVAAALWAGAGTLVAVGLNQPLAHLVGRTRPYDVLRGVEVLVPRANDFTFPSDHATAAGAVVCGLFLARRRKLAWSAAGFAALLAFARVYVGAHYPTDVIAGLAFGAAVVAVLYPLAVRILVVVVGFLCRSPLAWFVSSPQGRSPDALPAGASEGRPRAGARLDG